MYIEVTETKFYSIITKLEQTGISFIRNDDPKNGTAIFIYKKNGKDKVIARIHVENFSDPKEIWKRIYQIDNIFFKELEIPID